MKTLYSVYDKKAKAFGPVMAYRNDVIAIRDFSQVVADENSLVRKYPEDFDLFAIARFEDEVSGTENVCVEAFVPYLVMSATAAIALEKRDDGE